MSAPPPDNGRLGMAQWAVNVVRALSLQNLLTLALLVVIGVPTYFAYLFLTDVRFRHDFMTETRIVDADVPCLVIAGNVSSGGGERFASGNSYDIRDRVEYLIVLRTPSALTDQQLRDLCDKAHVETDIMRAVGKPQARPSTAP